jgi:geranylgeranyl pyrophosphate synthase
MHINEQLEIYRQKIDEDLQALPQSGNILLFYEPIRYINELPGKRIRPLLTLLSGLSIGGDVDTLMPAATAVELLHNFSLVHDDIMDDDDLRRGKPTVHVKWDMGTAILAGDGLLGLAYRRLLQTPGVEDLQMVRHFTDAMLEICEGQALDKTFENSDSVSESEYLEMIEKKTATLIRLSCQLGGIAAKGDTEQIEHLVKFGYNIGMGFQIQDDLLDIYADEVKLGKPVGSDLVMQKKTIITIRLKQQTGQSDFSGSSIEQFKHILQDSNILGDIRIMVDKYFNDAKKAANLLPKNQYSTLLRDIGSYIQNRDK